MAREHLWDNWQDEDLEEEYLTVERRQYRMYERIDLDKWDDEEFFCRFRLQKPTVCYVLEMIRPQLKFSLERSRYIKPITQLLLTLRFYALGTMQISVGDFAGVSQSSVSLILQRVTKAIAAHARRFIRMPETTDELLEASKNFYAIASFPKTIGAIDCTHIKIQSPGGANAENFRNRKGWFSINVQTVASADLKIINVVARWPGASHDQQIFNNSSVKMRFERGDFGRFILIGDSGYRNTHYLATPFLQSDSEAHQVYNESQIRSRNVVERSYGVWKRRFPVLALGMRVKIQTVQQIIVACAILHNIAIDAKERVPPTTLEGFEEMLEEMEINLPITESGNRGTSENVRAQLVAQYFPRLMANMANENNEYN